MALSGLVLTFIGLSYARMDNFIGPLSPSNNYLPATVGRAQADLEDLEVLFSIGSITPEEYQERVLEIAGRHRRGVYRTMADGTTVDTDPGGSGGTGSGASTVDMSGDDAGDPFEGLPDVPSFGYSVNNITYAGFEPRSINRNVGVTDIAKAGKDWVYRYLVNNNIDPNSNWAQAAAAALNQQYGTDEFKAINPQILVYGDEAVRTTQNGYGLRPGQYDPNARGQFFWGYGYEE